MISGQGQTWKQSRFEMDPESDQSRSVLRYAQTETISMGEVFSSAAKRHWDDAAILFSKDRFDNAAYLAGYVVECSLKFLIKETDLPPKSLSHDLSALSGDALLLASLITPSLGRYEVPVSPDLDHLIAEWSPTLRYLQTGHTAKTTAQSWLRAAEQTYCAIVIQMTLDGRGDS